MKNLRPNDEDYELALDKFHTNGHLNFLSSCRSQERHSVSVDINF